MLHSVPAGSDSADLCCYGGEERLIGDY